MNREKSSANSLLEAPSFRVGSPQFTPGIEEDVTEGHIVCTNVSANPASTTPQEVIDEVLAQPALPWMAHPDWTSAPWIDAELALYEDYTGIEVYSPSNVAGYADVKWDALLSKGIHAHGMAVDDCHNVGGAGFNIGWVHVFADSLTVANIIAALTSGNFYSSTGPTMTISESGGVISVTTPAASKIEWITYGGYIVKTTTAAISDTYTMKGIERYIRVRITRDSDGKRAYTNPITGVRWRLRQPRDVGILGGKAAHR